MMTLTAGSNHQPSSTRDSCLCVLEPPRHLKLPLAFLHSGKHLIGADEACAICIVAPGVQRRHALVVAGNQVVILKALDPRTWVNDSAVTEKVLRVGDRVSIGPITFRVRLATTDEIDELSPGAGQRSVFSVQFSENSDGVEPSTLSDAENDRLAAFSQTARRELADEHARHSAIWNEWEATYRRSVGELNNQLEMLERRQAEIQTTHEIVERERVEIQRLQTECELARNALAAERDRFNSERDALHAEMGDFENRRQQHLVDLRERDARIDEERRALVVAQDEMLASRRQLELDRTRLTADRSADFVLHEQELLELSVARSRLSDEEAALQEIRRILETSQRVLKDQRTELDRQRDEFEATRAQFEIHRNRLKQTETERDTMASADESVGSLDSGFGAGQAFEEIPTGFDEGLDPRRNLDETSATPHLPEPVIPVQENSISRLRAQLAQMFDLSNDSASGMVAHSSAAPAPAIPPRAQPIIDPEPIESDDDEYSVDAQLARLLGRPIRPSKDFNEVEKSAEFANVVKNAAIPPTSATGAPSVVDQSHLKDEPKHRQNKNAVREEVQSFRAVARISARTALAKHSSNNLRNQIYYKIGLTAISAAATVWFGATYFWGGETQAWKGLTCGATTMVCFCILFRASSQLKKSRRGNPEENSSRDSSPADTGAG